MGTAVILTGAPGVILILSRLTLHLRLPRVPTGIVRAVAGADGVVGRGRRRLRHPSPPVSPSVVVCPNPVESRA
jgi:hypothetical protein